MLYTVVVKYSLSNTILLFFSVRGVGGRRGGEEARDGRGGVDRVKTTSIQNSWAAHIIS